VTSDGIPTFTHADDQFGKRGPDRLLRRGGQDRLKEAAALRVGQAASLNPAATAKSSTCRVVIAHKVVRRTRVVQVSPWRHR